MLSKKIIAIFCLVVVKLFKTKNYMKNYTIMYYYTIYNKNKYIYGI